ncbi:DMT family transporter [Hydrogenophaga sp.]|uniref:DMT family transporter n=1 Tax=Hydrogenophaga sp. TaxID=1904254 RepID=UPI0026235C93|nr:DMT family transporter [Hydrogenophaga sp.]MCW5653814.1 DMT family transporter [Hydrogenophaga sp.]
MSAAASHPSAASPHLAAGLTLAVAGSIAFSAKAIIVKLAYRYGVDAVTLLMYRMLFSLPLFLALAWWASYRQGARLTLKRRDWLGVIGLGFTGYYLASFLDFWGLQFISASLERLILYLNPTLVLILGWLIFRRRITGLQAVAMAVSYGGVLLVFGHEAGFQGPHAVLGALLVFGSAFSYAIYLVYSGEMVKRLGSMRLVGLATSVAAVLCLVQFVLLRPLSAAVVAPEVLWLSLLNATLCTFAPVVMVMMAVERIGAGLSAQVGMIGPMSTLAMGALILDEPFNAWIIGGTVLVVSGVFLVTRFGAAAAASR